MKRFSIELGLCLAGMLALGLNADGQNKKYIDPQNMDLSVRPGDDFYTYASGTWIKNNPVPAKETRWGSFNELRDFNVSAVKNLLEEAAADQAAEAGSVKKRVGDFYTAAMDTATIEQLGYDPIKKDLKSIEQIKDLKGVISHAAYMRTMGIGSPLFRFSVGQDRKNVEKYAVQLSQGGTTLPDRDYYLDNDTRSIQIRKAYLQYIQSLFHLTGAKENTAIQNAATVMSIEKKLAAFQMTRVEMRDPYKTYNKYSVAAFNAVTPKIDWKELLNLFKVEGQDTVLVSSPSFFSSLDSLIAEVPLKDWKTYLEWNVLKDAAPNLSSPFVRANLALTRP